MAALLGLQQGWRIVPGNEGWTFDAFEFPPPPPAEPPSDDGDPLQLPSMADLLLQGSSDFLARCSGRAYGKPVAVKESSTRSAIAVLGEGGTSR